MPISKTTLSEEIASRLTGYILEMGLKPGDQLPPERELIARLKVGRSSLREALKILGAVGAVDVQGREGTFVGRGGASLLAKPLFWNLLLENRSMEEVIEARRIIEVDLAGLAAERADEEEVGAVGHQLELMRASVGDADTYSEHDVEFHLAVAEAGHNSILSQVLVTTRHILRAWIRKNISDVGGTPHSLNEHVPIYEAIARHDVEAAREAMEQHLERAASRIVAGLSAQMLRE